MSSSKAFVVALALLALNAPSLGQLSAQEIEALRRRGEAEGWTFRIGPNPVTNRPLDQLCGAVEPPDWRLTTRFDPCLPRGPLPSAWDWRQQNGVTPVKDQNPFGTCWAFATMAMMESAILIRDAVEEDLSEQWLIGCCPFAWEWDPNAPPGYGGGWHTKACEYLPCAGRADIYDRTGAVLESDFPYVNNPNDPNFPPGCPPGLLHYYNCQTWAGIGHGWGIPSPEQIKQAILDYGPVAVAVYVYGDPNDPNDPLKSPWRWYAGGVFNAGRNGAINHIVTLVGWDDSQGTSGVWFMKNSWGTAWGEDENGISWDEDGDGTQDHIGGYMRIEYGCCNIGYAACYVAYPADPPCTGACCFEDGHCELKTSAECDSAGGVYEGDRTVCDPDPCLGACCFDDGNCEVAGGTDCDSAGGVYQGPATVCDPNPCLGACCFGGGHCEVEPGPDCGAAGGAYQGTATVCDPNPCSSQPSGSGACCFAVNDCEVLTPSECAAAGGMHMGAGTACYPNPCIPRGACCFSDGHCEMAMWWYECYLAGGNYMGDGTDCPCGACCWYSSYLDCSVMNPAYCAYVDGYWMGPDTSCASISCDNLPWACCFPDGHCEMKTATECAAAGGAYHGDGTVCDPNPCPQPGACCFEDGHCEVKTDADCWASYQGAGTVCDPNPCPPAGACCYYDDYHYACDVALCIITTERGCEFGYYGLWLGEGTSCNYQLCAGLPRVCCDLEAGTCFEEEDIPPGYHCYDMCSACACHPAAGCADLPCRVACCFEYGYCEDLALWECYLWEGNPFPLGTKCDQIDCPWEPPSWACCFADGHCEMLPEAECITGGGTYKANVECNPNPCQGGCCFGDGHCEMKTGADCDTAGGVYQGGGTVCDPNPCQGGCCFADGHCEMKTGPDCDTAGGAYQGGATVCDPNPCPPPISGACCFGDGHCEEKTSWDCLDAEGEYEGDGTVCEPNPCPPGGACCFLNGDCEVRTAAGCSDADGTYQGDNTFCYPNPCPPPRGACCLTEMYCQILTPDDCQATGGAFVGIGVTCEQALNNGQCMSGPCCFWDGTCDEMPEADCWGTGGIWCYPLTMSCTPNPCPHPGDMNGDGAVDFGDINPFVLALADWNAYRAAFPDCHPLNGDINRDLVVDFGDINPFVSCIVHGGCP
jgi:hypothetical protein